MFKFIGQMVVNAALPTIKTELLAVIGKALDKAPLDVPTRLTVTTAINTAITNWTIKL